MFYIYFHLRADNNSVFYVGKGNGRRAYVKRMRSNHWNNIVAKHGYIVKIIEDNLTEDQAKEREVYWIAKLGRIDLGTGCLVNFTNGGEGSSGRPMNDYTKSIISECNKNRTPSKLQKKIVGAMFKGKFGNQHNRSKKVRCKETGKIYGSQSEAARELKISVSAVNLSVNKNLPVYNMNFENIQ